MNTRRLALGFGWGVVATVAMSIPMVLGFVTGISPMPVPVPLAVVSTVLGVGDAMARDGMPDPFLLLLAASSHLAYGGFWGAILFIGTQPVTVWKGLGLGVFLWLIMQVAVLPLVGWGPFGAAISPLIGPATLLLHLIYGTTLGWLGERSEPIAGHPAR